MLAGKQPVIYGDGLQSRDFTFVANVVKANLLAADAPGVAGRMFNAANGKSTDLLTLIRLLNEFLGLDIKPIHEPARVGDVRESLADITHGPKVPEIRTGSRFRGRVAAVDRVLSKRGG